MGAMARAVVLASLFTAAAWAARVAESQADVHASDFIPVHPVGPRMPIAKPALTGHRPSVHATPPMGARSHFFPSSLVRPAMPMQNAGEDSNGPKLKVRKNKPKYLSWHN